MAEGRPASPVSTSMSPAGRGGYFFVGELLLLNWETHLTVSSIEDGMGREVPGLEWLDDHALRLLLAPPDDWQAGRVEFRRTGSRDRRRKPGPCRNRFSRSWVTTWRHLRRTARFSPAGSRDAEVPC